MKKTILMGIAALMLCGTVNANSWRVCSKPEAGANFLSVAAAVASNSVFAGDTLYIEPGHVETGGEVNIEKQLTIIGPGYNQIDNNINTADNREATFAGNQYGNGVRITAEGCKIYGCCFTHGVYITANYTTIKGCKFYGGVTMGGTGSTISQCLFYNCDLNSNSYHIRTTESALFENNIIFGRIAAYYDDNCYSTCTFRNNTVITASNSKIFYSCINCEIYNNIIINTDNEFTTNTVNQITDTTWNRDKTLSNLASCNVYNNILSSKSDATYLNCIFNKSVEEVLIWNNANTFEEKFKHLSNGPAVGAGVNGTTCGAYGVVTGGRAYQPAGIPQRRPYIYDANIDETPSSNNTINASFKIKVQQ